MNTTNSDRMKEKIAYLSTIMNFWVFLMATILDIRSEELKFYPYSERMMRHPPETVQYRG